MTITIKEIFKKIGYDFTEFSVEEADEYIKINNKEVDMVFWSILLNPEFCKKVFGEENKIEDILCNICETPFIGAWQHNQYQLLKMRNENKTIDEVLEYIEQNTILELSAT